MLRHQLILMQFGRVSPRLVINFNLDLTHLKQGKKSKLSLHLWKLIPVPRIQSLLQNWRIYCDIYVPCAYARLPTRGRMIPYTKIILHGSAKRRGVITSTIQRTRNHLGARTSTGPADRGPPGSTRALRTFTRGVFLSSDDTNRRNCVAR